MAIKSRTGDSVQLSGTGFVARLHKPDLPYLLEGDVTGHVEDLVCVQIRDNNGRSDGYPAVAGGMFQSIGRFTKEPDTMHNSF